MYKFTRKDDSIPEDVKHKFDIPYATWDEVVGGFQVFLIKCGYTFAEGFDMAAILKKEHTKLLVKEEWNRERNKWT